ncbi:zinc finger BED domain-containing protein RICESLEEPER 2-like [Quercus robur]|uniref:zinc finger BED domain-containing protein RICESLEEPER 2-like n=1 Tax=Quercus robur TaxID=38942 RepID=UPI0021631CED|nr:zinc finger BED domain-containing protein RICESLEEPER 2-like [Quercus robur]
MEADNENYQINDVERDDDEFDQGSDHVNSHKGSSDVEHSVNDYDYDFEQRNASQYLAALTCTINVLLEKDDCLKLYEELRNFDGHISLSVDILSCRKLSEYMCLKAHFIDEDWNLMNWVLNFRRISELEDDYIVEATLKALKDWDIGNKIAYITFPTGSVDDKQIDEVKDYVQETKKLQFNGQPFRLYCCADIFKRMVQDAFEAKEEFKEEDDWDKPSADEWKKVEGICKLLESLYNAAKAVFETKDSTAGIYFQNLQEFIRDVAAELHERIEKYWKKMFLVLAIATVMDPRYKISYFEFSSSKYGGNDSKTEVSTVLMAVRSLYDDYNTRFPINENLVSNSTSDSESETPRAVKQRCLSSDASNRFKDYKQFIESTTQPLKSELDLYLEEHVLPWTQDFNILSWWRAASPRYPVLSRIACDYLSVPVSVVTSVDELFTMERGISRRRYASLKPDLINAIMCTRSWFPAEVKSVTESSLGLGEMLEDMELVDDLI